MYSFPLFDFVGVLFKRPFFYKTALKFSRLMVSFTLLSTYFSKPVPLLSEVKAFCLARGFCSRNSLESIFLLFRALGFMTVSRHSDDSRLRVFSPSSQACEEIRRMLTSVVEPLGVMCSGTAVCGSMGGLDDRAYLARYFKGFSVLLSHNVTIDLLMPDCYWLVKRDAGHMLMLAIYNDACALDNQGASFRSSSYLSIAEQLSVSKTHVIRLVQEGPTGAISRFIPRHCLKSCHLLWCWSDGLWLTRLRLASTVFN